MARQFASAFKASLEAHLRKRAEQMTVPFSTLQLKFVIERLLARLFREANPPWLLKGGFAMDLRFRPKARTTKDIDLSIALALDSGANSLTALREKLQEAADVSLGDYLTYHIGQPKHELTNAPKGGGRYPCEAILVGKTYAKFHIDVGIGDALVGEPDRLTGDDILSFAGIEPLRVCSKIGHSSEPRPLGSGVFQGLPRKRCSGKSPASISISMALAIRSLPPTSQRRVLDRSEQPVCPSTGLRLD